MTSRVAAVDIGSNTARLLIAQANGGQLTTIERRTEITGLGQGVDRSGQLRQPAMKATWAVLAEYGRVIREAGVVKARAVATSATREANNRQIFLQQAERALGFAPKTISGRQEGRLAFAGATHSLSQPDQVVVVDIGGGSTEFVSVTEEVSVDLGSIRLTERCLPQLPARPDQLQSARDLARQVLASCELPRLPQVVGVAGTWTSLAAIAHFPSSRLDLSRTVLSRLIDRMAGLTRTEMEALPGLDPKRAPVILGGALIAWACLQELGRETAQVSVCDLLDGVAWSLLG